MSELAQVNPQQALIARIRSDEYKQQIALALDGDAISPDKFVRVIVTAILDNPDLVEDPPSLFQAGIKAAQDGLLPDGREAVFVQYKDKKTGTRKAQYMPMIGGLRKIAGEYGWSIQAEVVYENDTFEERGGLQPDLIHVKPRIGRDRGPMSGAYAIARHRDGRPPLFKVMSGEQIEKVKQSSRASQYGPWVDWPERMAEKTVARRLFKELPLADDDRVERVLAAEPDYEESMRALYSPRAPEAPPSPAGSTPPAGTTPGTSSTPPPEGTVASHGDEERGATPEAGDAPEQTPSPGSASPEPAPLEESYAAALEEAGLVESPLFEAPASVRQKQAKS